MTFLLVYSLSAAPQIFTIAGDFRSAQDIEKDIKKEIKSDKNIEFRDTVYADLNMDGIRDRVFNDNGIVLDLFRSDSTFYSQKISSKQGALAIYDANRDSVLDIVQIVDNDWLYFENISMPALQAVMVKIPEDTSVYVAYTNFDENSGINYVPSVSNENIQLSGDEKGVHITPNSNWTGTADLKIAYSKGDLQDTVVFSILVLPVNDAPRVLSSDIRTRIDEDQEYLIHKDSLLQFVFDPDPQDKLTITLLQDHRSVTRSGKNFIYQAPTNWSGEDTLYFLISDGKESDTLTQYITVSPVNDRPQWVGVKGVSFPEDELLRYPISWFAEHASDVETPDSLLRFHVYSGKHVLISAEGQMITLMPEENWFGKDKIRLTVSDGELVDTLIWDIEITPVNDAPVLSELPDTMFYEDNTFILNRSLLEKFASDIETPSSKLKWQVKHLGRIRVHYNGARIRCTTSQDWYGTDSLELTVSDGELSDSRIWKMRVLPVNDAPAWDERSFFRSFLEDENLKIKKSELYKMVHDPETVSQNLDWKFLLSDHIHLSDNNDHYLVSPDANWFGLAHIDMIVSDGEFADTLNYALRIVSVNDKPEMLNPQSKSWNEDDTLQVEKKYFDQYANDIESKNADLIWSYFSDHPQVMIKENKNSITLSSAPDWNGHAKIGLIIYDGGLRDTGYMDISVKPVNDAPRWLDLPDTNIAEDGSMLIPLSFIRQFVYDPDEGDKITLEYREGDNFYIEEKGDTIEVWPLADWYGKETFEFTASDGKKKVKKTWTISVFAVNDPPYFTMGLPDSITFKANGTDTLIFRDIVYDIDNKTDELIWDISGARITKYTYNEKIGGIIFFTENYEYGEDAITLRVTDGHDVIMCYLPIYVKEVDRFLMSNPEKLELLPNTPNPFRDFTDIRISMPVGGHVTLKIYDLLGKEIITLANGYHDAQNYSFRWFGQTDSGMPVPSGVYLCRMAAVIEGEPVVIMHKMMLVR